MARYEIRETRSVAYTVEVPDSACVAPGDLLAADLDSTDFWARGSGGLVADAAEVTCTVHPACDDDQPADVVLDNKLRLAIATQPAWVEGPV